MRVIRVTINGGHLIPPSLEERSQDATTADEIELIRRTVNSLFFGDPDLETSTGIVIDFV